MPKSTDSVSVQLRIRISTDRTWHGTCYAFFSILDSVPPQGIVKTELGTICVGTNHARRYSWHPYYYGQVRCAYYLSISTDSLSVLIRVALSWRT